MAQKITVQLLDDLDGTPGSDVSNVAFSVDGVAYEIDLNEKNATELRDRLTPFIEASRRVRPDTQRPAGRGVKGGVSMRNREQNQTIREWAKNNGHAVSDRGRISAEVGLKFQAAHAK